VVFVGEELTLFGFVREKYEKTLRTTGLVHNQMCHTKKLMFCKNEVDKYML